MNLVFPFDYSSSTLQRQIADAGDEVLFLGDPRVQIDPGPRMFERMTQIIEENGAGIVYADAFGQARVAYQLGSIRDNFEFGPLIAISIPAARQALADTAWKWGGLYDLRLRISEKYPLTRIPEPLYSATAADSRPSGQRQFDYVDPRNRDYQIEMEQIASEHLRRIGAYLEPKFMSVPRANENFPLKASVVTPVRNRERTVRHAVESALSQQAGFSFNVIVVDNHSTDRTAEILKGISDPRLVTLTPERRDLGIGGCWNEAIGSHHCGRYAVQLDSDDLYSDSASLQRMVDELESGGYAMAVGAYTMVNFDLQEIPPGRIDHREWTRDNGRNNVLRINGFGAPRAFDVTVLRQFGFPNVSYGEDYAAGLRISREYEIGRIYEPVYLCRRWEGNSDSALPLETANRYDSYKDWLRSNEIRARQRMNAVDKK